MLLLLLLVVEVLCADRTELSEVRHVITLTSLPISYIHT